MQEVKEVSCLKQEIKGIIERQQQTDADGTAEDAAWDRAGYFNAHALHKHLGTSEEWNTPSSTGDQHNSQVNYAPL